MLLSRPEDEEDALRRKDANGVISRERVLGEAAAFGLAGFCHPCLGTPLTYVTLFGAVIPTASERTASTQRTCE